jgi:hypothetical protein
MLGSRERLLARSEMCAGVPLGIPIRMTSLKVVIGTRTRRPIRMVWMVFNAMYLRNVQGETLNNRAASGTETA